MAKKKTAEKVDTFNRLAKEVKDLTGLNINSLKDKKVRMKLIKRSIPYVIFGYVGNLLGYAYRMSRAKDAIGEIMDTINSINDIVTDPMPSLHWQDILIGIAVGVGMKLVVYVKGRNAKKYRKGREYGSAELGGPKDIEPFVNREQPDQNLIFSQTEFMSMAGRMPSPLYNRNKNVLVIGGSGSGKTRFYAKPNLMQLNCSYVFTDPKGTVLEECGHLLKINGYKIKVLNTINFKKSMHYNPFAYIHCETDIMKVADALIEGTTTGKQQGEQFWIDAERLLYNALIGYIWYTGVEEEQNFSTLLDMVNAMQIREDDDEFKNAVDYMFDELEEKNPENYALLQYKKFKQAAGKTAKSILVSCGARLAPFDIKELRDITAYDELELDTLGDKKTALFLIMSDTDATFNFLISMIYTQLFNLLCEKADDVYGGRLPVHVRCLIDEAANIGQIPNLEKLVATIRSREISACVVLQAKSQLKAIYKDNADTIIGNMDSQIFLGGSEQTTLKDLNTTLGKETIDMYNTGESRGTSQSYNLNYQKLGKDLMSIDELAVMDGSKCIVQIRGVRPFFSDKYDLTQHPDYRLTADYDKRNWFDVEKFLSHKLILKADDEYEVIQVYK